MTLWFRDLVFVTKSTQLLTELSSPPLLFLSFSSFSAFLDRVSLCGQIWLQTWIFVPLFHIPVVGLKKCPNIITYKTADYSFLTPYSRAMSCKLKGNMYCFCLISNAIGHVLIYQERAKAGFYFFGNFQTLLLRVTILTFPVHELMLKILLTLQHQFNDALFSIEIPRKDAWDRKNCYASTAFLSINIVIF